MQRRDIQGSENTATKAGSRVPAVQEAGGMRIPILILSVTASRNYIAR